MIKIKSHTMSAPFGHGKFIANTELESNSEDVYDIIKFVNEYNTKEKNKMFPTSTNMETILKNMSQPAWVIGKQPITKKTVCDEIKEVKFYGGKTTVVFWQDGTKTVSVCTDNDKFDPVFGVLKCIYEKNSNMTKTQGNKFLDEIEEMYEEQAVKMAEAKIKKQLKKVKESAK